MGIWSLLRRAWTSKVGKARPATREESAEQVRAQAALTASVEDLIRVMENPEFGLARCVEACRTLGTSDDPRALQALERRLLHLDPEYAFWPVGEAALRALERKGPDGVRGIARGLRHGGLQAVCAEALARIGSAEAAAELSRVLNDPPDARSPFKEHLENALQSIRDPAAAQKREKREHVNDAAIAILRDYCAATEAKLAAIQQLASSGDSRWMRGVAGAFRGSVHTGDEERIINAALAALEAAGSSAVPVIASALYHHRACRQAAATLATIGTEEARQALQIGMIELRGEGYVKFLADALQKIENPAGARAREEAEARENAPYLRELKTNSNAEVLSALFEDFILLLPAMEEARVQGHFDNWCGGNSVGLDYGEGSRESCSGRLGSHLSSLEARPGFVAHFLKLNKRWECAMVTSICGGRAFLCLVWKRSDGRYSFAHQAA